MLIWLLRWRCSCGARTRSLGAGIAWTAARQRADPAWVALRAPGPSHGLHPNTVAAAPACLQVRAPFQLREFASGVKVIQAASHSDEAVCRRLAQLVAPQPAGGGGGTTGGASAAGAAPPGPAAASAAALAAGEAHLLASLGPSITRVEVAVALGVPVAIAGEELLVGTRRRCKGGRGQGYVGWGRGVVGSRLAHHTHQGILKRAHTACR